MSKKNTDLSKELKKYFGFSQFKGQQEKIIQTLLEGKDVFVLMPTGGGYQSSTYFHHLETCYRLLSSIYC